MGKKQNLWAKTSNDIFKAVIDAEMVPVLESGIYDMSQDDHGNLYMNKRTVFLDELLEFPSSINSYIIRQVSEFWGKKAKFDEYGFAFKRGILLHGKAGSGKSSIINLCTKALVEKEKGIVIPLSSDRELGLFLRHMSTIRKIETDRPVIVILEDIENFVGPGNPAETALLNVLDGIDQTSHIIYLATTNYPEQLKERITNRPSRFDRRIEVGLPSYDDRLYYFEHKLKESDKTPGLIQKWAKDTEGMGISHLAEIIKSVCVLEMDYQDILDILKDMQDYRRLHSNQYEHKEKTLGFSIGPSLQNPSIHEKLAEKSIPYVPKNGKIIITYHKEGEKECVYVSSDRLIIDQQTMKMVSNGWKIVGEREEDWGESAADSFVHAFNIDRRKEIEKQKYVK